MDDIPSDIREPIGQAAFAVTARVAMQLGRESISNSIVAILELVKNAYDADAETVSIRFYDLNTDSPFLVIEDNGYGMTPDQLRDSWMTIGTASKSTARQSKNKHRVFTGEKGLGRLGLDRLARRTLVQTFVSTSPIGVELDIDWTKYETTDVRLETVKHELYRVGKRVSDRPDGPARNLSHGTRLVLRGLRDAWDLDMLAKLRNELSLLVSPFAGVNDFSIILSTGLNLPGIDGAVTPADILGFAEWKVSSTIFSERGKFYIRHDMARLTAERQFHFLVAWKDLFPNTGRPKPACGPVSLEYYFFAREDIPEISATRAQVSEFLETNQGIRIYRDNFRVKPYGDPSGAGDWLGLALRKVVNPSGVRQYPLGSWRLGYNQVVGAAFISRATNNGLLDQTNRESIIEGPAFWDLRAFALDSIKFFEMHRQEYEIATGKPSKLESARATAEAATKASSEAAETLRDSLDQAIGVISGDDDGTSVRQIVSQHIETAQEAAKRVQRTVSAVAEAQVELLKETEEQRQEFQRQKNTLGNLASLGILAATFGHETQGASNLLIKNVEDLEHRIKQLMFIEPDLHKVIFEDLHDIEYASKRIHTFALFALQNIRRDKRERTKLHLDRLVNGVLSHFSELFEERGIRTTISPDGPIPAILAFHIDWESIIMNFITNSIWALEDTPAAQREIRVHLRQSGAYLEFSFADSGRGITESIKERIFTPTFSTKTNARGEVTGTGMGLAIVQSFVDAYDARIEVNGHSDLGGAEFHITVPIPELQKRGAARNGR